MSGRLAKAPSRVTVEDLLHLKRAERPRPEFWAGFEAELRTKQLAALVERKPWWNDLSVIAGRFGWLRLPVGATAALALTLISVHQYTQPDVQPSVVLRKRTVARAAVPAMSAPSRPVEVARVTGSAPATVGEERMIPKAPTSSRAMPEAAQEASREIAALPSPESGFDAVGIPMGQASLADSFAIQLAPTMMVESALIDPVGRQISFEDRSMSTPVLRRTAEVLPTVVAVTEQRCARLLAALGSAGTYAPEPSAPEHAKRSVIRYLAEDGWDRSMSRLQADADRLSIRF